MKRSSKEIKLSYKKKISFINLNPANFLPLYLQVLCQIPQLNQLCKCMASFVVKEYLVCSHVAFFLSGNE